MFQCFSLDLDIFNKDRGGPKGKLGVLSPSLSTLVFFLFFFFVHVQLLHLLKANPYRCLD